MKYIEKDVFGKHYPLITSPKVKWGIVVGGTLFVLLFTSLFQPFYLSHYDFNTKVLVISSWTTITLISLIFNLFIIPKIFPKLFEEKKWKVKDEIFWINYNIFFVAFGFFLFKVLAGFYDFNLERIIYGIFATIAVGFIPVTIYVLVRQHFITQQKIRTLEQKRLVSLINDKITAKVKRSSSVTKNDGKKLSKADPEKEIQIISERDEKSLEVKAKNLVYVTSDKNYIEVYVLTGNNIKSFRIRNRMNIVLELFSDYPHIQRTHRAFIVNLQYSKEIVKEGNTHKIILKNGDKIPVSRTYWNAVLDYLGD